jgi:flagellar biosynthesis/type III secretory pathway protein FliH
MSSTIPLKADTVTYSDHQVITPDPAPLRRAVVPAGPHDVDPVARAEQALGGLSQQFVEWMIKDCERLDAARNEVKASGMTAGNRDALSRATEDVKGNAGMLGFLNAAPVADSLGRLLEHTPDIQRIPLELVDQHVDAVRAIVREHERKDINAVAAVLTTRLQQVTEEFLRSENRERPEYLQAIDSPRLSPGQS